MKRIIYTFLISSLTAISLYSTAWCASNNVAKQSNNQAPASLQPAAMPVSNASMPTAPSPTSMIPQPPDIDAKGYVLMDADTGEILAQKNMNDRMPPASLTKLMTLYLIFQALDNKQIHLDDQVYISEHAWRVGGSRMFIKVGSRVPVQLLIQGIAVASGNDACVAMAEHVGGDESVFSQMMNQAATRLGMKGSHFTDSNGLPDPNHYTTPYDMAVLARAIVNDYPRYYPYFSEKWFIFNKIKQPNRNRLLWRDLSVDGLKTGHTADAGFCLVSSAKRDGMRLITVLLGASSDSARASGTEALLNYGFRFYKTYQLFGADKALAQPRTWLAKNKYSSLGIVKPLAITIPPQSYEHLKASVKLQDPSLKAPIIKGKQYGEVQVTLNNQLITSVPLIALENNPKAGLISQLVDRIILLCTGWFR